MPKIQTYTAETELSDNHVFITEDGSSATSETKKTAFSIVKTFLEGVFLKNDKVVGDTINSSTSYDSVTKTLTINSKLPSWIASTAYTTDNFVINENKLYKCTTAHTSSTNFDSSKWTKIGGDIDFTALSNMFTEGANFSIVVDTENNTFTFAVEGHTISDYTNNTSYSIGDIVIHSSSVYQCNTACTDSEWTDIHWTVIGSGQAGANAYVWIKWSDNEPTQDSDIKTTPSAWIGIYSGTASVAPTVYTSYAWYKYKGETGATGSAGSHIYFGTAITGTNTTPTAYATGITYANIDDVYISTATGSIDNMFKCTTAGNVSTALWAYVNCIKGDGATIDDTVTSSSVVWSSTKVNSELANKADKTIMSSDITLAVADWNSTTKTLTISTTVNTAKLNTPIPKPSSIESYTTNGVYLSGETSSSYTFTCKTIPSTDIVINMKSEVIA